MATGTFPDGGNPAARHGSAGALALAAAILLMLGLAPARPENSSTREVRQCAAQRASGVPQARQVLLARGFNLTGWLDGPIPRPPDVEVLMGLLARGLTHVRLPVTAERLMEGFSGSREVAQQMAELDKAIDGLVGLGFGVSLDLHPGERLGRLHVADPDHAFELIEALWRVLARRYASRLADRLFFEVLNEPRVEARIWNSQGPRLVQAIRREAPHHTLIYGPANYQRIEALLALEPLADPNIVYAVHYYDPMVFTHQGLDWSDDPLRDLQDVPFPARLADPAVKKLLEDLSRKGRKPAVATLTSQLRDPWTEQRVAVDIARAAAWGVQHRRPVIINEFGVLSWKSAAIDRARWLRTVRTAAERHCVAWAHWDYADGFGFVRRLGNREIPDEAILGALLGDQR